VLLAMFGDTLRARQAFRVPPGFTMQAELNIFADALVEAISDLRQIAA
jgi:cysteine desulfurase